MEHSIVRHPLRVLLMSDNGHGPGSRRDPLMTALRCHRLLTSFGIAVQFQTAKALLGEGRVNTIFIDPDFGYWASTRGTEPTNQAVRTKKVVSFIKEVRSQFPWVVFVIYGRRDAYEMLIKEDKRFSHYFFLEYYGCETTDLDESLERCVDWNAGLYEYDLAISFAGEDRHHARELADTLTERGVTVFFDEYVRSDLLGKDLYAYLQQVYSHTARYCIMLVSEAYADKLWTNHERRSAQERALRQRGAEYIIPIRLDNTPLPGLLSTVGYARISEGIPALTELIIGKLWKMNPEQQASIVGHLHYVDDVI
jgi:hypothetical protein